MYTQTHTLPQVDLLPPPDIPFGPADWLPQGLPQTDVLEDYLAPGRPSDLFSPLWCPVPQLGPVPDSITLEWDEAHEELVLRSVNLSAQLEVIRKTEVEEVVVPPKPKPPPKKKKKPGVGGVARPAAAPAPASPRPGPGKK